MCIDPDSCLAFGRVRDRAQGLTGVGGRLRAALPLQLCSDTRRDPHPSPPPPQVSASQVQQRLSRVLGRSVLPPGRANGLGNMLESARKRAALAAAAAAGRRLDVFPSLLITADALTPQVLGRGCTGARNWAPGGVAIHGMVCILGGEGKGDCP